jgi:peptide/nickel transport system ATP-binding protein
MTMTNGPLLEVKALKMHFPFGAGVLGNRERTLKAIDGVSFAIRRGETLGLVGESGCGKSTVGKLIMRLLQPTAGAIRLDGHDMLRLKGHDLRQARRQVQMVFQDPYSSLNPRLRAETIVGEPIESYETISTTERQERVAGLFDKVGLRRDMMNRFPFEFSGGQRQRLGIARALALSPALIVADEPVSALDVSVQAQVINLMVRLQKELRLAYLFISHDLAVVEHIAHRVAVMYLGKIVEIGPKREIFAAPRHPYTRLLLSAVPVPDPRHKRETPLLGGDVPSPLNPPSGCAFSTRCPLAFERCRQEEPSLILRGDDHLAACHFDTAERLMNGPGSTISTISPAGSHPPRAGERLHPPA